MTELMYATVAGLPLLAGWSVHALRLTRRIDAARRDPLTGLWTRDAFEGRARKSQSLGEQRAVFVLDLNWFKQINDTHGHAAGDAVIRATGMRLGVWAAGHHGVAGRLGGDEFAAVTDVPGEADTGVGTLNAQVLELLRILERPVPFEGRHIDVFVSVGVARYWRGTADLSALLRQADEHMYRAKREGGGASNAPKHETTPALPTIHGRPGTHTGVA
ncbi:diguanylate cyclase (GGDEF) domain-containing protein [Streptomyces sp. 2231.1]|uniref:GGDEF domain-containing protein n=1 Tax=Streptomyces sp. 2231.1 TaxID=1855347 RepID=UPI00089D74CB|nr:GGDEF domain-containing protein [Streptomyces sp. 2231.1]SED10763.1 diguanylate cyclase (GGDEF) domain-containing protein [Streptomyces sp. 2231.1]